MASADACIIGSGPAGAAVASALAERGLSVIVLERGGHVQPADDVLGKGLPSWDGLAEVNGTVRPLMPALVGGAGEINGAVAHRLLPEDFALASRYRPVPGAAVADWPFDYAELEPYYARAEALHGVSGTAAGARHLAARSTEFPHPPLVVDCEATRLLEAACARGGLHVQPTPVAILSRDTAERGACARCGICAGYPCLYGAKGRPTVTSLRAAAATGRCAIVPNVHAHRLILGPGDRAVAVEYSDANGRKARVEAERFVLAAGALFTPLLLQQSRSPRFPNGLGNHADLVGRFLCAHPCPRTAGVFAQPVAPPNTHFVVRSIDDLYFLPEPLWKGGLIELQLLGAVGGPPKLYPAPGRYALPPDAARRATLYYCSDAVPLATNRVVASRLLDRFGVPLPRVELTFHPLDVASARFGIEACGRILRAMGATEVIDDTGWAAALGGGFHYSGTARAGADPATSVVDAAGRVHDCANVYVADASLFPTSGGANPMLTVIASALRVADRMAA